MTKKDVKHSLAVQVMSTNRSCQQKSRKSAGVLLSVKKQITKYILPRSRRLDLVDHLGPALGGDGSTIRRGKGPRLAFLTFPRWALAYNP